MGVIKDLFGRYDENEFKSKLLREDREIEDKEREFTAHLKGTAKHTHSSISPSSHNNTCQSCGRKIIIRTPRETIEIDENDNEPSEESVRISDFEDSFSKELEKQDDEVEKKEKEFQAKLARQDQKLEWKTNPPDEDEIFRKDTAYERRQRGRGAPVPLGEEDTSGKVIGAGFRAAKFLGEKALEIGSKAAAKAGEFAKEETQRIGKEAGIPDIEKEIKKDLEAMRVQREKEIGQAIRQRIPLGGAYGIGKLTPEQAQVATQALQRKRALSSVEKAGLIITPKDTTGAFRAPIIQTSDIPPQKKK